MKKQADYIKRIEIKRLWGRKDISWELRPDVNILSGVNGIGKSTILNRCWQNKQPRKNNLNYTAIRNQTLFTDHKSRIHSTFK